MIHIRAMVAYSTMMQCISSIDLSHSFKTALKQHVIMFLISCAPLCSETVATVLLSLSEHTDLLNRGAVAMVETCVCKHLLLKCQISYASFSDYVRLIW